MIYVCHNILFSLTQNVRMWNWYVIVPFFYISRAPRAFAKLGSIFILSPLIFFHICLRFVLCVFDCLHQLTHSPHCRSVCECTEVYFVVLFNTEKWMPFGTILGSDWICACCKKNGGISKIYYKTKKKLMIKWLREEKNFPDLIAEEENEDLQKKRWSVSISVILLFSIFVRFSLFSNYSLCLFYLDGKCGEADRKLLDYSLQFIICTLEWE